jgi:hypothetical protein
LPHKYGKATSEVAQACIFFTRSSGMNLRLIPGAANVRSGARQKNRQNEPSFTHGAVQSGSITKAIEFFLDTPADVLSA